MIAHIDNISEGTEMRSIGVPTQYGWYPPDIKSGGTSIGLGSLGTQTNDGGAQLPSHIHEMSQMQNHGDTIKSSNLHTCLYNILQVICTYHHLNIIHIEQQVSTLCCMFTHGYIYLHIYHDEEEIVYDFDSPTENNHQTHLSFDFHVYGHVYGHDSLSSTLCEKEEINKMSDPHPHHLRNHTNLFQIFEFVVEALHGNRTKSYVQIIDA
jgi:hypothetical protein